MPPDLRPDTGSEFTEFRDKPDLLNILFMNMKKIYFLLLGSLLMCGGAMTSCTSDESGGGSTSLPENTFSVGDASTASPPLSIRSTKTRRSTRSTSRRPAV